MMAGSISFIVDHLQSSSLKRKHLSKTKSKSKSTSRRNQCSTPSSVYCSNLLFFPSSVSVGVLHSFLINVCGCRGFIEWYAHTLTHSYSHPHTHTRTRTHSQCRGITFGMTAILHSQANIPTNPPTPSESTSQWQVRPWKPRVSTRADGAAQGWLPRTNLFLPVVSCSSHVAFDVRAKAWLGQTLRRERPLHYISW